MTLVKPVLATLLTFALVSRVEAQAADTMIEAFRLSEGDRLTSRLLADIFGCKLFPVADGRACLDSDRPIFASIIGLFNVLCITLGGAMLAWNTGAGVAQTAHEGVVLGSRWSSLWAAPRVLLATAFLVPLPHMHGYNGIQTSIAWMVRGSTEAATILWANAADKIVTFQAPVVGVDVPLETRPIRAMWQIGVCQEILARILFDAGHVREASPGVPLDPWQPVRFVPRESAGGALAFSAAAGGTPRGGPAWIYQTMPSDNLIAGNLAGAAAARRLSLQPDICGTVTTPDPSSFLQDPAEQQRYADSHRSALEAAGVMPGILAHARMTTARYLERSAARAQIMADAELPARIMEWSHAYREARQAYLTGATERMLDAEAGQGLLAGSRAGMNVLVSGQHSAVCRHAAAAAGQDPAADLWRNTCRDAGSGQGWAVAGIWYLHLSRLNLETLQLMRSVPSINTVGLRRAAEHTAAHGAHPTFWSRWWAHFSPEGRRNLSSARADAERAMLGMQDIWDMAAIGLAGQGFPIPTSVVDQAFADNAEVSIFEFEGLKKKLTAVVVQSFGPDSYGLDPMVGIMHFGNWLLEIFVPASIIGTAAGDIPFVGGLADVIGVISVPIVMAGAFLAFVVPLLPCLFWVFAVTGYFLLVAEAILAANFWAISHLRMDGEGIAGDTGRQGYFLVLALTATPLLMIFGFLVGMGVFRVTTSIFSLMVNGAIEGLAFNQSIHVWAVGLVTICLMMIIVHYVMAERSFMLVTELPSQVLRWVGASAPLSSDEASKTRTGAIGVVHQVFSGDRGLTTSIGRLGRSGIRGVRSRIQRRSGGDGSN